MLRIKESFSNADLPRQVPASATLSVDFAKPGNDAGPMTQQYSMSCRTAAHSSPNFPKLLAETGERCRGGQPKVAV
jgi:hypothetical protein